MIYTERPKMFRAIKWEGDVEAARAFAVAAKTLLEIRMVQPLNHAIDQRPRLEVMDAAEVLWCCRIGEWLVIDQGGEPDVMSDEKFQQRFRLEAV